MIELLVVVAILGILASLLLPVLSHARQKAHTAQCVSNLRQMGQATVLYGQDNDDALPFAWYDSPDPRENSFYALLTPKIYKWEFDGYGDFESHIYSCPVGRSEPLVPPNPMRISYGMNASNAIEFPAPKTWKYARVSSPVQTLLVADLAYKYNHPPLKTLAPREVGYKHRDRANFLFLDGHAAALLTRQTNGLKLNM